MKFQSRLMLLWLLLSVVSPATAHEVRPAVATLDVSQPTAFSLVLTGNIEAMIAGIGTQHKDTDDAPGAGLYKELRALPPDALQARFQATSDRLRERLFIGFDGARSELTVTSVEIPAVGDQRLARISTVRIVGTRSDAARTVRWTYPAEFGASVLRVKRKDQQELETVWLDNGAASKDIALADGSARGALARAFDYVRLGFTHILPKGLDHILFVVGLYLLGAGWRSLLMQVTAFTVAHSVTLALGLYDVVTVAPTIVEPLIALSIVYVAVENLLTSKLQPWRPAIVFAFGLLHGLGFAGVLQEVGLPRDEYLSGLIAFNVGVELGQLAVIALSWLVFDGVMRARPQYRVWGVRVASLAIALIGLFWTIERISSG
jgi:hydrogenase/urease accessory protein HupE